MVKYEELVRQLKSKQFAPVYLLMGEEPFYIDRICKWFETKVIEEADRDFNQFVYYGKDTTVADIVASAKQFPFGSLYRLVIVKEAKDIRNGIEGLKSYVENPMDTTILVVCHKYGKIPASKYKPFEKKGVVFESAKVPDWELNNWVQKQASSFKFQIDSYAANIFSEHIGNDLSRIYNELEKLKLILPANSVITPEIIEKYIGISKEYNIFELQSALGTKNVAKAYKIAINFSQHLKENPNIRTISMLYSFYHKLLSYQLSDKSPEATSRIFGRLSPSILSKNIGYAQAYSQKELTNIISILREYDVKSKGVDTNSEEADLLKEMIYKIIH